MFWAKLLEPINKIQENILSLLPANLKRRFGRLWEETTSHNLLRMYCNKNISFPSYSIGNTVIATMHANAL